MGPAYWVWINTGHKLFVFTYVLHLSITVGAVDILQLLYLKYNGYNMSTNILLKS